MQLPCKIIILLSLTLSGCASDPYQGIYEGIKSHNEGMKTPNERAMITPSPSYDSYKKERDQLQQNAPAAEKITTP
jgi:hypothetical protein